MSLYRTEGIVLKHRNLGEADKILTIITRNVGKVRAVASGVKRPRNRLTGGTQLFTYSDFLIFRGKNLDRISQCEIKHSFRKIREDLYKFAYASYIAELTSEFVMEGESNPHLFFLLLKTLYNLEKEDDVELITCMFETKLLLISGLCPHIDEHCIVCGGFIDTQLFFSAREGGVICKNCAVKDTNSFKVSHDALKTLNTLLRIKFKALKGLNLTQKEKRETRQILMRFLMHHIDKKLKSMYFLDKIMEN